MCVLTPILQMGTEAQRGLEVTRGHGARERQGSCRPGCPPCRAAPRPVTLCLSCPQLYQAEQESGGVGGGALSGHRLWANPSLLRLRKAQASMSQVLMLSTRDQSRTICQGHPAQGGGHLRPRP